MERFSNNILTPKRPGTPLPRDGGLKLKGVAPNVAQKFKGGETHLFAYISRKKVVQPCREKKKERGHTASFCS